MMVADGIAEISRRGSINCAAAVGVRAWREIKKASLLPVQKVTFGLWLTGTLRAAALYEVSREVITCCLKELQKAGPPTDEPLLACELLHNYALALLAEHNSAEAENWLRMELNWIGRLQPRKQELQKNAVLRGQISFKVDGFIETRGSDEDRTHMRALLSTLEISRQNMSDSVVITWNDHIQGRAFSLLGDHDKAQEHLKCAQTQSSEELKLIYTKAIVAFGRGSADEIVSLQEESLPIALEVGHRHYEQQLKRIATKAKRQKLLGTPA